MKMLSDNLSPIIDRSAIAAGRYVGTGPMNQPFLSTTGDGEWSIAMPHALGRLAGEGNPPRQDRCRLPLGAFV